MMVTETREQLAERLRIARAAAADIPGDDKLAKLLLVWYGVDYRGESVECGSIVSSKDPGVLFADPCEGGRTMREVGALVGIGAVVLVVIGAMRPR